jgi:xanthine dehydrogenase accessory factor
MDNIYLQIPEIIAADQPLAIATIIETIGSTPRKHGSSALFGPLGLISGTIGGGVLEARVQMLAGKLAHTSQSGLYHFDLNNDITLRQEAICGGEVTVLIDANPGLNNSIFRQIIDSITSREKGVLVTVIEGEDKENADLKRYWIQDKSEKDLPPEYSFVMEKEIKGMMTNAAPDEFMKIDIPGKAGEESAVLLLQLVLPPLKLVIAGAGHIGKALARMGKFLGFEITVIDDRQEFANVQNIPDADNLIVRDIGDAMQSLIKDEDTFIVIVTRGHDDDAKALLPCIGSGAAYTGMIGSKKKIAKMRQNFIQNGWATEQEWSRIHAPVGIDILSKTVEEIAVSIAAQLVLVRNSKQILSSGEN